MCHIPQQTDDGMSVLEERVEEEPNSVEGDLNQEGREMRISEHTQPQQCLHQVWHTALSPLVP